jgi:pyruvate/2-oxoglutarate dehydrogenase complex dihydrolipoamide acyltransferase (E2) component
MAMNKSCMTIAISVLPVSGPKGLMVPVVRGAEAMNFKEIETEIKRLGH